MHNDRTELLSTNRITVKDQLKIFCLSVSWQQLYLLEMVYDITDLSKPSKTIDHRDATAFLVKNKWLCYGRGTARRACQ